MFYLVQRFSKWEAAPQGGSKQFQDRLREKISKMITEIHLNGCELVQNIVLTHTQSQILKTPVVIV